MKVYNRNCEIMDKEVTDISELANDEYMLKAFVWLIGADDIVYLFKEDKTDGKYTFLSEYTDGTFEGVKSLASARLGNVNDGNFVFFSREISELENTIYDVWLYEIKSERTEVFDKKRLIALDKQKLKEYIHSGIVSDKIPCLNEYLNNTMRGRLYRKNTTDDITPYFNFKIDDEKSFEKLSEINNKKCTDDEIVQKIKGAVRACEMKVTSPLEFYHIVRKIVE